MSTILLMKKIIIIILLTLSINAKAETFINSQVIQNQSINWNRAGSPYIIKGCITLSNSTLTVNDAEIIFYNGCISSIQGTFRVYNSTIKGTYNRFENKILHFSNSNLLFKNVELDIDYNIFLDRSYVDIKGLNAVDNKSTELFYIVNGGNFTMGDSHIEGYTSDALFLFGAGNINIYKTLFRNNKRSIYANSVRSFYVNYNDFENNDESIITNFTYTPLSKVNIDNNYFSGNQLNIRSEYTVKRYSYNRNTYNICCSNIIFIPGMMSSRLYVDSFISQNQLWEPNRNADVKKLFLNNFGQSIYNVYVKGVIGVTNLFGQNKYIDQNIYNNFLAYLDKMKKDKNINEYRTMPYDWRMSPDYIIQNNSINIIDAIKDLQKTSKTNKVTIITHSNGGLVAKKIIQTLKDQGLEDLIDNVIFVAMPEYGTPQAITALLFGHNQSILNGLILKSSTARELGVNMFTAYNLLPSNKYFELTYLSQDKINKILNKDIKFNKLLFEQSKTFHNEIDNIIYPKNINIYQILGTGLNTVSDIYEYEEGKILPVYNKDGDGTVQDLASLRSGTSTYIDLKNTSYKHFNIMNNNDVIFNINNILKSRSKNLYTGLDYNKIIKNNNYKLIQLTNHNNDYNYELLFNKNQLYLDKINVNNINKLTAYAEIIESIKSNNRFEFYDNGINYLYDTDFDNFKINSKKDDEIDISVLERGSRPLEFENVQLFQGINIDFSINESDNTLKAYLPETGQSIIYKDKNLSSTTSVGDTLRYIKQSNIDQVLKDKYIKRLQKYKEDNDQNYLQETKNMIKNAITSINSFAYSDSLKARYSRLREGYIYLNSLLLKL